MSTVPSVSDKVSEFFEQYKTRRYSKGQILIFGDDNPDHIFYLKKGTVRQYDLSYRGDEIVVNVYREKTFFPMAWAINRTPNKYFFQAASDIEVILGDVDEVEKFIKSNPDVLFELTSRIYKGMDGLLGRMVHLMGGSAKGRLMYEILIECRRFGTELENNGCEISITESELAARAGLSRETVSREMRKIINEKLLVVARGKITVPSMPLFEEKLGKVV